MALNKLIKASVGVTIVMVLGYALSFVKEATIANYFGVSGDVDAYTIAIQIPVLLFSFVTVAVQSVVIPIYSDLLYNQGQNDANRYVDRLLTILLFLTGFIVIVGIVFAGPLTYLFAPGFNSEIHNLSVSLLRVTFPSIVFAIVCQVLIAILNVHKQFVLNSFAVYFLNITIIFAVVLLHTNMGVLSACIGQLFGDLFRCLFVAYLAKKYYSYHFHFDLHDKSVIQTLKMSIPVMLSISVAEVNAIVNRIIGSFLVVGSISALSYAGKINSVLMQLFVSAIATIVYPLYAESSAKNDLSQLNRRINYTLSGYSLFVIPLMCGVFVFKKEIITIAFARGAFDGNAIEFTQILLGCYAVGMLFMAMRSPVTNVFYSLKDTKTPALNAALGAVLNVFLNLVFAYLWGVIGLAIATSLTAVFISIRLLYQLTKLNDGLDINYFKANLARIIPSSVIMTFFLLIFHAYFSSNVYITMTIGTLLGFSSYFVLAILLKIPILKLIRR